MKLISDCFTENVKYLTEASETGAKNHYIEGIMLQADSANRNNRVYPGRVLEQATNRYINDLVKNNQGYGELNHPPGPQIHLENVCILIKELKQNKSDYYGKAIITNTPSGNIVKGLLESGARLGVSSRGLGSLKPLKENLMEVQDDYRLVAIDVVADPSAPKAFVNGIMENVEYFYNENTGEFVEKMKKDVRNMTSRQLEEQKVKLFAQFLKSL
jgi:hypothetical protein